MASSKATDPSVPRDVVALQSILKDMGVVEYEPAVIGQLLEFCYRYTTDILEDAKAFSSHASKKSIDIEDTKLSVQLKLEKSYTNPPPRELLLEIAAHKNKQQLPLIKPYTGPKLPADRYCLTAMNYQLRKAKKPPLNYTTAAHSMQVPYQRQPSQKATLLSQQSISIVGKQAVGGSAAKTLSKTNITLIPTSSVIGALPSPTTASAATTGAVNAVGDVVQPIKRKIEPMDDDYDV